MLRLSKITIEEVIVWSGEKEFRQSREIELERLLVEGNTGETEEIVLEVVEIPGDGLAVETRARVTDFVIQIAPRLDLESRQNSDDFAIRLDDFSRDGVTRPICTQKLKKRGFAQVFFKVGALAQILLIDLRDRQAMTAKMSRKLEEGSVLFTHRIEDTDGAFARAGEADNETPRAAKLALKRQHESRRRAEMLLKEPIENVHEGLSVGFFGCFDKDSHAGEADARRKTCLFVFTQALAANRTRSRSNSQ